MSQLMFKRHSLCAALSITAWASSASAEEVATLSLYTISPSAYSHWYGGGALGEPISGAQEGHVGGFEGARASTLASQLACGDYLSAFVVAQGGLAARDERLSFTVSLGARPSVARGAALSLAQPPRLNREVTSLNAQGALVTSPDPAFYALGEGEHSVRLISQQLNPEGAERFEANSEALTFELTGLDAGERLVVRLDLEVQCAAGARPRGDLIARLESASLEGQAEGSTGASITLPHPTLTLVQVEGLQGLGAPMPRLSLTPPLSAEGSAARCPTLSEARRAPLVFEPLNNAQAREVCVLATNTGSQPLRDVALNLLAPTLEPLRDLEQLNPTQTLSLSLTLNIARTTRLISALSGLDELSGERVSVEAQRLIRLLTPNDADGDGLSDAQELSLGTDLFSIDTDGDGLDDAEELSLGSDPLDADCDDDGLLDGLEGSLEAIYSHDTDGDGLFDGTERGVSEPHAHTDLSQGHFRPDLDPDTLSDHTKVDSDDGGCPDDEEDPNLNGRLDPDEADPTNTADDLDADGDGLCDVRERSLGSNPNDPDTDDDGLNDGLEPSPDEDVDGDGLNSPNDPDSDNDGLGDGLELGLTSPDEGTDLEAGLFTPDADPSTTTSPLLADTDGGGSLDGEEDRDKNGRVDDTESDPNLSSDDEPDVDGDGIPAAFDTCPELDDPEQLDTDGDGVGDPCDEDVDGDLVFDGLTPQRAQGCEGGRGAQSAPLALLLALMLASFMRLRLRFRELFSRRALLASRASKGLDLKRHIKRTLLFWGLFGGVLSAPQLTGALPLTEERGFALDELVSDVRLGVAPGDISALAPQDLWGVRLAGAWSGDPLLLSLQASEGEPTEVASLINLRGAADLALWVKLSERWLVSASLPFVLMQGRDDLSQALPAPTISEPLSPLPAQALGDLKLGLRRYVPLSSALHLAFGVSASAPTGPTDAYSSERAATYGAHTALTYQRGALLINASLQHLLRPLVSFVGHERQDLSQLSLGGAWRATGLSFEPKAQLTSGLNLVAQSDALSRQALSSEGLLGGSHHALNALAHVSYELETTGAQLWASLPMMSGLSTPAWSFGLSATMRFKEAPWSPLFEPGALFGPELPKPKASAQERPQQGLDLSALDQDGDKILDEVDLCPEQAGSLIAEGCPSHDMDGDSVHNKDDACPWTAGEVSNLGCPAGELAIPFKLRRPFIFDFGEVTLTQAQSDENKRLEQLAAFLRAHPQLAAHLSGHTDYKGKRELNMKVSEQRVRFIRGALLNAGVNPEQLSDSAFGEEEPLVYDSLHAQRLLNRRVTITYYRRAPQPSPSSSSPSTSSPSEAPHEAH